MMQADELASLPVGTEVSAKYKGAFCEAKVKNVHRQVKCKVSFKQSQGSFVICDSLLKLNPGTTLVSGCTVETKHPDKGTVLEAVVTKIFDQSQYIVVFDDGDIATLRRNALCMKSGKHFNASESLDNLPLTHPEHFGTPVGSRRRAKFGEDDDDEDEDDDSSDDEAESVPYITKLGTVVRVEISEKKSTKSKENWFPGLVVSPHAQDQVKINTKEDFLIRSFKDHRYYTVPKKECKKFHKDSGKCVKEDALTKAIEHALAYLSDNESLPIHWDREILFDMRNDSSTEGSSDDEEILLSDDEDIQSPEEKDHLVAELYKHMDDRGTPINRTPSINNHDIDLYKLFRLVQKLGGHQRVNNNNQWKTVAKRLGFETNWCVNQVRVCYRRYLQSFEELYKQLGWTLVNHPRSGGSRARHGSGRPLARGVRVGSKVKEEEDRSDRSSVSSQDSGEAIAGPSSAVAGKREKIHIKEEIFDDLDLEPGVKPLDDKKSIRKNIDVVTDKIIKDEPFDDQEMEIFDFATRKGGSKEGTDSSANKTKKGIKEEMRMMTRPRRDSSSSLTAATELKAKKEEVGEAGVKVKKDLIKKEIKKSREDEEKTDSSSNWGKSSDTKTKKIINNKKFNISVQPKLDEDDTKGDAAMEMDDEASSDLDSTSSNQGQQSKRKSSKVKGRSVRGKGSELAPVEACGESKEGEEPQHLKSIVECAPGDKIKVFWLHGQIYEAKIIKLEAKLKTGDNPWPKYYVHYQGWNQRYDEWITRGRIAENLTWNSNPMRQKQTDSNPMRQKQTDSNPMRQKQTDSNPMRQKKAASTEPVIIQDMSKGDNKTKIEDKVKKSNESDNEKDDLEDTNTSDIEDEEKESEVQKIIVKSKARSLTPTSTPSSSRTNSPANNRRTKSPAPKRQSSPAVKPDKTPNKSDKKKIEVVRRTNSPVAPRKSPTLKRQSSRTSLFKPSEDEEVDDEEEQDTPRRSTRNDKEKEDKKDDKSKRPSSRSSGSARIILEKLSDKSSDDSQEPEDLDDNTNKLLESQNRINTPNKKGTPSKSSDSDDPYIFQEPEPLVTTPNKLETPTKETSLSESFQEAIKREHHEVTDLDFDDPPQSIILTPVKDEDISDVDIPAVKAEIDLTDKCYSEDESKTPEQVRHILTPVKDIECLKSESEDLSLHLEEENDDFKSEIKKEEDSTDFSLSSEPEKTKSVLQFTDRYASLFPHLASLRTTTTSIPTEPPLAMPIHSNPITSATLIGNIVESSILKETESKANLEKPKSPMVSPLDFKQFNGERTESEALSKETVINFKESLSSIPTKPRQTKKKSKKVRSLRNPTHKSREVVTDSDTDTEDEKQLIKSKPITPRRKTVEGQLEIVPRSVTQQTMLKRLAPHLDSEEDNGGRKQPRRRKVENEDEDNLVCDETIPGSPVHPGVSGSVETIPSVAVIPKSASSLVPRIDDRPPSSTSRLEMPFATVPESVVGQQGKLNQRTITQSDRVPAAGERISTPPGTPDSSNSGELTPLAIVEEPPIVKDEDRIKSRVGSKSPEADSSEVDMDSLSGRGKAGSEDSRLDVECSSSSDTRLVRGRRRGQQEKVNNEKIEPSDSNKSPLSVKRKRKTRADNTVGGVGRGRGKGRGRHGSGVGIRSVGRGHLDDTDESETRGEGSESLTRLDRLDNEALAALAAPKPNSSSKYNFFVQLKPEMDQATRISALQTTLENLRKTYMSVKGDLSTIERRRKKIRRKERERSQLSTEVTA